MSTQQDNRSALEKITTGDLSESGMTDEEFNQFFNDVQQSSTVLQQARMVPVSAPSDSIPRLSVGTRVARGVAEGESASKQTVNQPGVDYTCQKLSIPFELSWESVNESIGDFESEVRQTFIEQFAADIETMSSVGDESSSDPFEQVNDGFLVVGDNKGSPLYNHDDAGDGTGTAQAVDKTLFSGMRALMPERYKERQNLVFLGSNAQKEAWQEALTERGTAAADAALLQGDEPTPYGHTWLEPLGWPDTEFAMTSMQNLAYVVEDSVRIKSTTSSERNVMNDISGIYNLLAKVDYQIMEPEGFVRAQGVAAP